MADVKLVVIYPPPKNADDFEKVYQEEHVPLAVAKLSGKTKIDDRDRTFLLWNAGVGTRTNLWA